MVHQSDGTILYFYQQCMEVPLFHILPTFDVGLFNFSRSGGSLVGLHCDF